jgi:ribonuclease Z
MKRIFPPEELTRVFRNLGLIFISHLHADHHLGVIGLLKKYIQVQESEPLEARKPVFIIAPFRFITFLYEYSQLEVLKLDEYLIPFNAYDLIPHDLRTATKQPSKLDQGLYEGLLNMLSIESIETCFVPHCQSAYGVGITDKSGFKVVYSGDCRPSPELVALGRDATLLIHEATLADHELEAALDKMHSTTSEAIDVGKRMNAANIFLTHFSQKYTRVPEFVLEWSKKRAEAGKYENVSIAFDRMRVKVRDLWKIRMMYPVFEQMYAETGRKRKAEEMEDGEGVFDKTKTIASSLMTAASPLGEQRTV